MQEFRHEPVAPTTTRVLGPGGLIDAHVHDQHQLVYARRGVVSVTTDAGVWVTPGSQAIWVPAGTVHAHRAYGELELRFVGLPVEDNPLGLAQPTVVTVSPLLREIIVAYTARTTEDDARSRLRAVLFDELRAAPGQAIHVPSATHPLVRRLGELLDADPAADRTLAQFGRSIGASDRTLSRLIRADLGMTFPQWRTQVRLHRALVLLAEGAPVTEVAHRCGWSSASTFIDVFRRAFGRTPGSR